VAPPPTARSHENCFLRRSPFGDLTGLVAASEPGLLLTLGGFEGMGGGVVPLCWEFEAVAGQGLFNSPAAQPRAHE
jgi:hypothetical protein